MLKRSKACFYCGQVVEWEDSKVVDTKAVAFDQHYSTKCDEMQELYPVLIWRIGRDVERYMKEKLSKNDA